MVLVTLDFSNAFNLIDRATFLAECDAHMPGLSRWVHWCYDRPSQLRFGKSIISSEVGVQQGDPLGPLLFSLALHVLLRRMARETHSDSSALGLLAAYLDDGVLAGPADVVARAVQVLCEHGPRMGLHLNPAKCELVLIAGAGCRTDVSLFPQGFQVLNNPDFKFLGAPIGSAAMCQDHTSTRVADVRLCLMHWATCQTHRSHTSCWLQR